MDGVVTNQEVAPGTDAGPVDADGHRRGPERVMDLIDFSGMPYPGDAGRGARVALILAKYAVLGIVPLVDPAASSSTSRSRSSSIPRQQGTDLAYIQRAGRRRAATSSTSSPGPAPGMSIAYWGPEIRVGVPQPALNVDMDAHTNVESLSFTLRQRRQEAAGRLHPEPADQGADPDPDPGHHAAQPAARARSRRCRPKHRAARRHGASSRRCRRR